MNKIGLSIPPILLVRFRHWLHIAEVADGVRVVSMVRNQAIPRNLEVDGYHCKVSYYGQAKECDMCEKTGHTAKDCPFRGKCLSQYDEKIKRINEGCMAAH